MKKMIIVGSGIAGSAAKRIAEARGWETTVIDSSPASTASKAALATIRPTWFAKDLAPYAKASWEMIKEWGGSVCDTAIVTAWRDSTPVEQPGWWLADPAKLITAPDLIGRVKRINGSAVVLDDGSEIGGDAVLMATGSGDESLNAGWDPLPGATLVSRAAQIQYDVPLRVHRLRPYHDLTVGRTSEGVRLGSSAAKTQDEANKKVWEMLDQAYDLGLVNRVGDWELITGVRARRIYSQPILPELGNPVARIGSLAKSGFGLSPAVVLEWIDSL